MFQWGIKEEALKSAVVDCAVVDYAITDKDGQPDWDTTNNRCSDFQPLTMRCGIVDIAIVDYATVDWGLCACTETDWLVEYSEPYNANYHKCNEEDS